MSCSWFAGMPNILTANSTLGTPFTGTFDCFDNSGRYVDTFYLATATTVTINRYQISPFYLDVSYTFSAHGVGGKSCTLEIVAANT